MLNWGDPKRVDVRQKKRLDAAKILRVDAS